MSEDFLLFFIHDNRMFAEHVFYCFKDILISFHQQVPEPEPVPWERAVCNIPRRAVHSV